MNKQASRALAPLLLAVACDAPSSDCETICHHHADRDGVCDFIEEPTCNPVELWLDAKQRCDDACAAGSAREECPAAARIYAHCIARGDDADGCRFSDVRYDELCVLEDGAISCPLLCASLAVGCFSYEDFGFRGDGCDARCFDGVTSGDCREAQYALLVCQEPVGNGYGCGLLPEACADALATVDDRCGSWERVTADPAEVEACSAFASSACGCGLFEGDDACALLAVERCLFTLGRAGCAAATATFGSCMDEIATCDRATLATRCAPSWSAWSDTCE